MLLASLTSFAVADDGDTPAQPAITVAAALPPAPPVAIPAIVTPVSPERPHRFFDLKNSFALSALAVTLTGDSLSTQKGLGLPGFHEMNPLARPFVQSRPGAAVYAAGSFALLAGGMYVAHRTHHHKLERIVPFAIAGWEGFLTWRNYHLVSQAQARR